MSNTSATVEKGLGTTVTTSAANKSGESIGNRAVNWVIDKLGDQYGKALVLTRTVYGRYLEKAYQRYNQVKTLVTGIAPRPIIGQNSIYIRVGVDYNGKEYDTATVDPLLTISKNLLVCGTGGAGKSMLMRYLFLNTVNRGEYIPVFLELRRISDNSPSENTFMDLIYKCMQDFDTELPREQFEYSLRLGKYIFFLDGFDEIKGSLVDNAAEAIQKFASKYPENAYIMTSRPDRNFSSFETFTQIKTKALTKEQAVTLSGKFWEKDEKTKAFCDQLENSLYDVHIDFAKNPLLLSMMFLTFMHNGNIPDHRVDFYEKCYDALYNMHDNRNKGTYKREFECVNLNEQTFKQLFARFCYRTYIDNNYEFTRREIISVINKCITKLQLKDVDANKFLNDLCKVVCMIVREGNIYHFSHRSLQAYFTAVYVTSLPDEHQKLYYSNLLRKNFWDLQFDAFVMAYQLAPDRFVLNALETPLQELSRDMADAEDPEFFILSKLYIERFNFVRVDDQNRSSFGYSRHSENNDDVMQNVIFLIRMLRVNPKGGNKSAAHMFTIGASILSYLDNDALSDGNKITITINQLPTFNLISEESRKKLIRNLIENNEISEIIFEIKKMLQQINGLHAISSSTRSIFDDL